MYTKYKLSILYITYSNKFLEHFIEIEVESTLWNSFH
jgi:hypothetical protein